LGPRRGNRDYLPFNRRHRFSKAVILVERSFKTGSCL
jgi:hypothetical protein